MIKKPKTRISVHQITVDDLLINVIRKDIKNLRLSIHPPDGRLQLAAPLRTSDETVRLMVMSKMTWIKKHIARFAGQPQQATPQYVSGESHYLKGQRYILNVVFHDTVPKVRIRDSHIDLYVRTECSEQKREQIMNAWYRQQLKTQIPILIAKWQPILGVEVRDWGIRQMKTKWGTCNTQAQRIWLNLYLIQKPEHCLEYVVVHEMVHLLERHHNARFFAYMDKFLPQWRIYRHELNQFPLSHAD